jgi:hypothetical protein
MSIKLLQKLAGSQIGLFSGFINQFSQCPRIAWYPSAGRDFRPLLYLNDRITSLIPGEPVRPDLFLFTDYFPKRESDFLQPGIIYSDRYTTVRIRNVEKLPIITIPLHHEIVYNIEGSTFNGTFIFMDLSIDSIGNDGIVTTVNYPVLYGFVENESFYMEYLKKYDAQISHLIRVRYGGGLGGGGHASGQWLRYALCQLQCEIFINDGDYRFQIGDKYIMKKCPELNLKNPVQLSLLRTTPGHLWSNHGDVLWEKVKCL